MTIIISLVLAVLIFSCNTSRHITHESKRLINDIDILLEFNQSQYAEFGIPTKSILPNIQLVNVSNDTFKIKNDSIYLYLLVNKDGTLLYI